MSSGKIHSNNTQGIIFGTISHIGVTCAMSRMGLTLHTPFYLSGLVIALVATPDQDVDNGFIGDYYMRNLRLGWWWFSYWKPYKLAMKHRGFVSHFPIISSAVRLSFLIFPPIIILLRNDYSEKISTLFFRSALSLLCAIPIHLIIYILWTYDMHHFIVPDLLLGMIVSDTMHWTKDTI